MEDFRKFTLVELLNEIFVQYNKDWETRPGAQKYYCISKRLFVSRIRRAGHTTAYAYRFIRYTLNNLSAHDDFDSIENVDFLDELEMNIR